MRCIEPAPVIILASRGAQGSMLAGLLGAHPELCGAPHLNILAFEYAWQQEVYCWVPRDSTNHGLLRFLGQCLVGEQTVQSVQAARRWLGQRSELRAIDIYFALASLVAPKRLVDYSPLYAQNATVMRRVADAVPDAKIIHLVRCPFAQAQAVSRAAWQTINASLRYWTETGLNHPSLDPYEIGEQMIDWSVSPPVFDPQFSWYRTQKAALDLFQDLPEERRVRVRAEDLAADPRGTLRSLLAALDVAGAEAVIDVMLSSDRHDYMAPGPFEAPMGIDFDMIRTTVADAIAGLAPVEPIDPLAALPWRGDEDRFQPEVVDMARELGYRVTGASWRNSKQMQVR